DAVAQVVQLRPPHPAGPLHLDLGDLRRVQRERPLHALALHDPADRERLAHPLTAAADHHARVHLRPLLRAFEDALVHVHRVADLEGGDLARDLLLDLVALLVLLLHLQRLDAVDLRLLDQGQVLVLHDSPSFPDSISCAGCSRRRLRSSDCSRRQRAIAGWLPLSRMSGTSIPRKDRGRVYWGYSSRPASLCDSSATLAASPSTPGT